MNSRHATRHSTGSVPASCCWPPIWWIRMLSTALEQGCRSSASKASSCRTVRSVTATAPMAMIRSSNMRGPVVSRSSDDEACERERLRQSRALEESAPDRGPVVPAPRAGGCAGPCGRAMLPWGTAARRPSRVSVTHGLVEVCLQRARLAERLAQHALVDLVQGVRVEAVQRLPRALRATGRLVPTASSPPRCARKRSNCRKW